MHLLINDRPVPIGPGAVLAPDTWLLGDNEAAKIMLRAGGGECRLGYLPSAPHLADWSGKKVCILRGGRFGDLTLLTPCLRRIKELFPTCILSVAVLPQYRDAILGLPYIDDFPSYPLAYEHRKYDLILSLEPLVSLIEDEQTTHLTDIFAQRLGLPDFKNKEPDYYISKDEADWAIASYPRQSPKRVAVHIKSSTPSRDYPHEQLNRLIGLLHKANWDIMLLGLPHQFNWKPPAGVKPARITACMNDALTFRQSCAVLSTCDAFVGPDSGLIHIAGAIKVPALGLFSNVPWQLRTAYCPTTTVLQSKANCELAPCFHAGHLGAPFPINGPCARDHKCTALAGIEPERVIAKLEGLIA